MNNLTTNRNYLSPAGYRVTIDSTKFANIEYFCTGVSIPSMVLGPVSVPFRGQQNFVPGEKIEYSPFDMTYMITENMDNYSELFNWIKDNAGTDAYTKYDIILHIMNSSNKVNKEIRLYDAFPTALSSIDFSTQKTDIEYVTGNASFNYTNFKIIK